MVKLVSQDDKLMIDLNNEEVWTLITLLKWRKNTLHVSNAPSLLYVSAKELDKLFNEEFNFLDSIENKLNAVWN